MQRARIEKPWFAFEGDANGPRNDDSTQQGANLGVILERRQPNVELRAYRGFHFRDQAETSVACEIHSPVNTSSHPEAALSEAGFTDPARWPRASHLRMYASSALRVMRNTSTGPSCPSRRQ